MNRLLVLGFVVVTSILSSQGVRAEEWYDNPSEHLGFVVDSAEKSLDDRLARGNDTIRVFLSVFASAPRFISGPSQGIVDSLNDLIVQFTAQHFELRSGGTLQERVEAEFDSLVNEWHGRSNLMGGVDWVLEINYLDNRILSLRIFEDVCISCNGHPSREYYFHFALPDLNALSSEGLFVVNAQLYLDSVGALAFRRDQAIPAESTFHDAGYGFRGLNSNFQITDSGLVYLFNAYEIASGAYGESTAFLSWEQLKPVIRSDGPLGWVLREE